MKTSLCPLLAAAVLMTLAGVARAVTEVDANDPASESAFDSTILPGSDLLYNRPITTTAGPDLGFSVTGMNDGAASSHSSAHDTFFGNGDLSSTSLASDPVVKISLNLTASPEGYTLTSIQTINGWQNYDRSFSDQSYMVYASKVSDPTNFSHLLATVNYHPFQNDSDYVGNHDVPASSEVTLTNFHGAVGVADLEFILMPSTGAGGTDAQGGSVIREFEAFGITSAPEPSTYALMLGGLAVLGFVARRKSALFRA